jgi:hypothetical protein
MFVQYIFKNNFLQFVYKPKPSIPSKTMISDNFPVHAIIFYSFFILSP